MISDQKIKYADGEIREPEVIYKVKRMYVFAALASVNTILSSEIEMANISYTYP